MTAVKKQMEVTPIGKVEWFSLVKEDKFGNYTCVLHLEDSPETHKLISKIDSVGVGRKPYTKQADGSYKLKMKLKPRGTKKDGSTYIVNPPVIYDSLGKKIDGQKLLELNVGNGSEIRAKIELSAYEAMGSKGVSCKPKSIQISKLVEFNGSGDFGFDALELNEMDQDESDSDSSEHDF